MNLKKSPKYLQSKYLPMNYSSLTKSASKSHHNHPLVPINVLVFDNINLNSIYKITEKNNNKKLVIIKQITNNYVKIISLLMITKLY